MILFLTHTDLDAVGSIILSKYFNLNVDKYILINYEDLEGKDKFYDENIKGKYDFIYIVDLAIPDFLYNQLKDNNEKFLLFDHHKLTEDYKGDNVYFDITKSGTKLFYDYLKKGKRTPVILNKFVKLVDTYDMWKKTSPLWEEAQNLSRVLYKNILWDIKGIEQHLKFINFQLTKLKKGIQDFYWSDTERGNIQDAKYKENVELRKAKEMLQKRTDSKNFTFGVFMASSKISKTCTEILDEGSLDYLICINTFKGVNGRISVRSVGDFDCNWLKNVKGHKNAGGGIFEKEILLKLWEGNVYELGYN